MPANDESPARPCRSCGADFQLTEYQIRNSVYLCRPCCTAEDRDRVLVARVRNRAFIAEVNARTVCAHCTVAARAAQRLIVAADDKLAEANALTRQIAGEPPLPLVDLTVWLRGKVGRWFPWVLPTDWQAIACVLLRGRP